jgi:hypothetical protein
VDERATADARRQVIGGGVGLQEGEERLLDGKVAGVAGGVDLGPTGDLAGVGFAREEAPVVRGSPS